MAVQKMHSILRWAGSKRKLLVPLERMYADGSHNNYIEPFCGSACLFFHIKPERAVLGDTNSWLIETYNTIASEHELVADKFNTLVKSKVVYNKIRSIHYSKFCKINSAAYFLYLNRLCFNGLFRMNKKQLFNVPYSNIKTGNTIDRCKIKNAAQMLKKAKLCDTDFVDTVVNNVKSGDFVYLDPPYATTNSRIFRQYNSSNFGIEDIKRLDDVLEYIDSIGAKFVLSYADTSEMNLMKKKWNLESVTINRNIAGFSSNRKTANEIILRNY